MTKEIVKENIKNWYTVKVQNNRERSVSDKLRFDMNLEFDQDINILVPTRSVSSVKSGKVVTKEQILYPGYIFVETSDIDKVQHLSKSIDGMTSILKDSSGNAIKLRKSEVDRMVGERETPATSGLYMIDESVTIVNGPFSKFTGNIKEIDYTKDKVKIEVFIFGRSTMVDLTIKDISK